MNKKIKTTLSAIIFASAMFSAFAQEDITPKTWYFDTSKGNVNLSDSWGSAGTDGLWYTLSEDGETKTYMQGEGFNSVDTLVLDSAGLAKGITITLDKDVDVSTIRYISKGNEAGINMNGTSNTIKLNVGTIDRTEAVSAYNLNKLNLTVSNQISVGSVGAGNVDVNNMYSVKINGYDTNDRHATRLTFSADGTAKERASNETDTLENGILSPDAKIGVFAGDGIFLSKPSVQSSNLYYEFEGLKLGGIASSVAAQGNYKTHIILTNTERLCATYSIREYTTGQLAYMNTPAQQVVVIMNGEKGAAQGFRCNQAVQFFVTGGVIVKSGQLGINFSQNINAYTYLKGGDDKPSQIKFIKTDAEGNALKDADGNHILTTYSHGNLTMDGENAVFSSLFKSDRSEANEGFGAFRFTNINYNAGKIKLRLVSGSQIDSIDLTSYAERTEAGTLTKAADGKITAFNGNGEYTYTNVKGGTVNIAEGKQVIFDFTSDDSKKSNYEVLKWLIDDATKTIINEDKGAQIIAWDAAGNLQASDFTSDTIITDEKDIQYNAFFTVTDDGLYVKYVAVPEPSTYAAIFGALALGFAIYRRRK